MKNIMDAHSGRKFNLKRDRRALLEESERPKVPRLEGGDRASRVIGGRDVFRT
jgi:hypothetical protein